jgi:hypothetical protein
MSEAKQDLVAAIASNVRFASTQSLDLSFNELMDMFNVGELDINPAYQRLFRWSLGQQSRFIESLLLEMPVPPIFVIEEEEGKYQLIDGLQRISSYLHFRGKLKPLPYDASDAQAFDPAADSKNEDNLPENFVGVETERRTVDADQVPMLRLEDCDIVTELNGATYDSLPMALQIRLKRAFIRVEVVRKETDPRFKYHMFKRLNTGGDSLSAQQVRNATIRLLDPKLPDFIIELSKISEFKKTLAYLTSERWLSAFDQELVVRFFALKNSRAKFKHEVEGFLTDFMEGIADKTRAEPFDYALEERCFRKTFSILSAALGEYAFAFANRKRDDLSGGFSIYHFESIVVGLQLILDQLDPADGALMERLSAVLRDIKLDGEFIRLTTGGGKNSPGPMTQRIGYVERRLIDAFGR